MSIQARRERDKQGMREAIVNAARDLMHESGAGSIGVREIAKRIEYSPSVIYAYFEGRDAIITELFDEGVEIFAQTLQSVAERERAPVARFRSLAQAYRQFALANPELYQILFNKPIPGYHCPVGVANKLYAQLEVFANTIKDCISAGLFRPVNSISATQVTWAMMHGMVSLEIIGVQSSEPSDDVYALAINSLLAAWKA